MNYIRRLLQQPLRHALERGKSVLLLGARQTGKTTLINHLQADHSISFIQPIIRQQYEKNPSLLTGEIEALAEKKRYPLVLIDEIQKVPEVLDAVQDLIDRRIAQFILTGSSARKLRTGRHINLLPGRVVVLHLDPLTKLELAAEKISLEQLLLYGAMPGIITATENKDKETDLASYVTTYLEEEIRMEAVVRQLGTFSRFLTLAASESGHIINLRKVSQEIGVAHTTIASYYQILEDCLIAERIDPLTKSKTRQKLIRAPKYIIFDLGVRRLAAGEGINLPREYYGRLLEQWVGLELLRMARLTDPTIKIYFWRDPNGPEVDWILLKEGRYIPIEVKWTNQPNLQDAKHLQIFLAEYKESKVAYIICQVSRKIKLADNVYALPWQEVASLFAL
jgi:predicted AAA+ superfamily ATPase